jgi:cyclin A
MDVDTDCSRRGLPTTRPLPANMCPEYFEAITAHLRASEKKHQPSKSYLADKQPDVNEQMRSILVDWLNEVMEEFRLKVDTLCLTVNVVDRYLSRVAVPRNLLQLVGIASMLIASKVEEIVPPTIADFVYITDNTYTRDEVIRMELAILNELRYDLTVVTVRDFLGIYLKLAQADRYACMFADYLTELTLQEYAFLRWSPSVIAAAAVVFALFTGDAPFAWSDAVAKCSLRGPHELNDCLREMHRVLKAAPRNALQAVREKYSHAKYLRVSSHTLAPGHAPSF